MDDANYTIPDGGGTSFSAAEWARAKKAAKKLRNKLAQNCKHLIKSTKEAKPRKANRAKIKEERERMEQKERDAQREANGYEHG